MRGLWSEETGGLVETEALGNICHHLQFASNRSIFSFVMKPFLGLLAQVNLHPLTSISIRPVLLRKSRKRLIY